MLSVVVLDILCTPNLALEVCLDLNPSRIHRLETSAEDRRRAIAMRRG